MLAIGVDSGSLFLSDDRFTTIAFCALLFLYGFPPAKAVTHYSFYFYAGIVGDRGITTEP
jgi:hypothetical protein